jgi:plasmid maintenance system antidote protein VapI
MNKNVEKYFPSLDVTSLDWIKDPFVFCTFESAELTIAEAEGNKKGRKLKLKHSSTDMASFWLSLQQEYPIITKTTTEALISRCLSNSTPSLQRRPLKHSSTDMASFWLSLQQEYPIITKKTTEALLPVSTSCLCEAGFSAMNTMRSENRSRLQTLEEFRVCLSTIRPTRDIMRPHQAQFSH